jgi:DNA-binding FadR family transcriptional regulator
MKYGHGTNDGTQAGTDIQSFVKQSPFDGFVRRHGTTPRKGVFGYFVHELGRRIVSGEMQPGTNMPNEPELAEQFGISRTIIRESMKCLAAKGLVEIRTRTGTRIRERSYWHHLDTDVMVWYYETGPSAEIVTAIKDLRYVLEPEASARAAIRGTEAEHAEIAAAYEAMAASMGDVGTYVDADMRFHAAIFSATQNMIYAQLIDLIAVAIHANHAIAAHDEVMRAQKRSLPFHKAVLDAILARDADEALAASKRLLESWKFQGYDI